MGLTLGSVSLPYTMHAKGLWSLQTRMDPAPSALESMVLPCVMIFNGCEREHRVGLRAMGGGWSVPYLP